MAAVRLSPEVSREAARALALVVDPEIRDAAHRARTDAEMRAVLKRIEDAPHALTSAAWDESKHYRHPAGTANRRRDPREGGQFAPKGQVDAEAPPRVPAGSLGLGAVAYLLDGRKVTITGHADDDNPWVELMHEDGTTGYIDPADEVSLTPGGLGMAPANAITVTGRSLKVGSKFWVQQRGDMVEAEITEIIPNSRYRWAVDSDGRRFYLRNAQKVLVDPVDFPAAAKRAAVVPANHVTGEGGKVFSTTPGPRARATKVAQMASDEYGAIGLTIPDVPAYLRVPLSETRSESVGGFFTSTVRDGEVVPVGLKVRGVGETPEEMLDVMHHELGHYFDATLLRDERGRGYATDENLSMAPVMEAIDRSRAIGRVKAMAADSPRDGTYRIALGDRSYPIDREHAAYLKGGHERWARAWEQYVATKAARVSGNPARSAKYLFGAALPPDVTTYTEGMNLRGFYGAYWDAEDFAPIEAAIDEMLRKRGWLRN